VAVKICLCLGVLLSQEFDAEMQRMKQKLETIKTSREEVQEEMKKVRSRFLEQLAGIADPRKSTIH